MDIFSAKTLASINRLPVKNRIKYAIKNDRYLDILNILDKMIFRLFGFHLVILRSKTKLTGIKNTLRVIEKFGRNFLKDDYGPSTIDYVI